MQRAKAGIILAIIILSVAYVLVTPMNVDGESMQPTLSDNDYMLVNKMGYLFANPEYGDVAVVNNPSEDNETKMVKRVVGKPNDVMEVKNNILYRNGEAIKQIDIPEADSDLTGYGERLKLGAGEYYMLGDNSGGSSDSRSMGAIEYSNFVGKVLFH